MKQGATVIFGENTEMIYGTAQVLTRRAKNEQVAGANRTDGCARRKADSSSPVDSNITLKTGCQWISSIQLKGQGLALAARGILGKRFLQPPQRSRSLRSSNAKIFDEDTRSQQEDALGDCQQSLEFYHMFKDSGVSDCSLSLL